MVITFPFCDIFFLKKKYVVFLFFTIYVCMFVAVHVYAWVRARKSEEEAASFRAEIPGVCRILNLLNGAGI